MQDSGIRSTPRHTPTVIPRTIWLTGLSGAGKSTLASGLGQQLKEAGYACYVLDGDVLRNGLCRDLGFSAEDRSENIRRVAEVARLMNEAGIIVIAALISPYQADRLMARNIVGTERFIEAYISTPIAVCESRDPKGLYRRAHAGELQGFTGVSAPYEHPENPEVSINTALMPPAHCVAELMRHVLDNVE
ncbi:adenylyl-sulfate kinase [Uliginosibacterium sp. H3]|uniref:Adenylyl-sulfate kinase n=1 Tax=Uliginosibacterium silvisoli TaxID=3114758 RepID=A0ABU6K960_9RHOO|nr:adenylyl-sulfate kinase [Uliginosibacterium sp. H3]